MPGKLSFPPRAASTAATLFLLTSAALGREITVEQNGSIQDALDEVEPGDTITISAGHYFEDLSTTVDGTADQRITVRGGADSREDVVLRGAGSSSRMFEVNHDYYTIESFTIDGKILDDANEDNYEEAYRAKLLYVTADRLATTRAGGYLSALDGLIVHDMSMKNAGGECLRLRYFVTHAEIYDNVIEMCGLYDFVYGDGGKNGEGIYIGSSIEQWDDGKNPTSEPDVCRGNIIRDNEIRTMGNEGVEVKEGTLENVIENNRIYMQLDVDSGGINSRGDKTIIRNNYIEDAAGAGVRLGGHRVDGYQYGVNNEVYGNTLVECSSFGLKISETPQAKICGNDIQLPNGEDEDDYRYTGGEFGGLYDATEPCEPSTTPPPTPGPTPTPSQTPGAEYLGCFADVRRQRTMGFGYKDTTAMNNEDCIAFCSNKGKRFAGTFRGHTCRCTNKKWKVIRHGESTSCTRGCSDDSAELCGGRWAVSSWEIFS